MVQTETPVEVDATPIIDDLLLALRYVNVGKWERFDYIETAVRNAREALNSGVYNNNQAATVIHDILVRILPEYAAKRREYEADPGFRSDMLEEYRSHMDALQDVVDRIGRLPLDSDSETEYAGMILWAYIFADKKGRYLPKDERERLSLRLETVRTKFVDARYEYKIL